MQVLVFSPFAADQMREALTNLPHVSAVVSPDKTEFLAALPEADAVAITMSLYDAEIGHAIAASSRIRWIHFVSSGIDPILVYPPQAHVRITNSPQAWAPVVAEHAVALLLALQRGIPQMISAQAKTSWNQVDLRPRMRSLEANSVAILGFGSIGQRIATLLKPFGSHIVAVARSERDHPDVEKVVAIERLDDVLASSDVLICALPRSPEAVGLLSERRLALLPPQAIVVNVGRGDIIDEAALVDGLRSGRIGGAGLDVFEREPVPADHPLWRTPNLILSPHVAGMGRSRLIERLVAACVENANEMLSSA